MNKVCAFAVTFCSVMAGLGVLFVHPASPVMLLFPLVLAPVLLSVYLRFAGKINYKNIFLVFSSLSSFAYTVAFAARLVVKTEVLSKDCLYLVLLLCCLTALAIAFSKPYACRYTALSTAAVAVLILAAVFLLSLLDTDFSAVSFGSINKNILLPFVVFSAVDSYLLVPLIKDEPRYAVLGSVLPPLYMLSLTLVAMSVLSKEIFFTLELPLVRLWQSTYIASFVNSFEVIAVIAVFSLCVIKAGLVVAPAASAITKKRFWLLLMLAVTLSVLALLFDTAVTLMSLFVLIGAVISVLRK